MALLGRQLGVTAGPPAPVVVAVAGDERQPTSTQNGEINLDNILALIPGEVVPLYITGSGLTVAPMHNVTWTVIVFWICFAICGVLRAQASKPAGAVGMFTGINWRLVLMSLIAFFVWAHAVSTQAQGPLVTALPTPAWGFIAMVLGVLAPLAVPAAPGK